MKNGWKTPLVSALFAVVYSSASASLFDNSWTYVGHSLQSSPVLYSRHSPANGQTVDYGCYFKTTTLGQGNSLIDGVFQQGDTVLGLGVDVLTENFVASGFLAKLDMNSNSFSPSSAVGIADGKSSFSGNGDAGDVQTELVPSSWTPSTWEVKTGSNAGDIVYPYTGNLSNAPVRSASLLNAGVLDEGIIYIDLTAMQRNNHREGNWTGKCTVALSLTTLNATGHGDYGYTDVVFSVPESGWLAWCFVPLLLLPARRRVR